MIKSPTIKGLKLDKSSKDAIKDIRVKLKMSKFLASALAIGALVEIFSDKKALKVAYNIKSTNWDIFFQAVSAIKPITQKAIQEIMLLQVLEHDGGAFGKYDYKQKLFWQTLSNGCKFKRKKKQEVLNETSK